MHIIKVSEFEQVKNTVADIAKINPNWFPKGFKEIHAVSNDNFFAAVSGGTYFVSNADGLAPGFKPAIELINAVAKVRRGVSLAFNEEYAIETLWHEMMHGRTGIVSDRLVLGEEPLTEGIIQLSARHTYHKLLKAMGGNARHLERIILEGFAYPVVTRNLVELITESGITGDEIERILLLQGNNWLPVIKEKLAEALNTKRVGSLLNAAASLELSDFKQKIRVQQKNAPLRSKESS